MQQTSVSGTRSVPDKDVGPLNQAMAIALAKHAASARGYPWVEPISVTAEGDVYVISTNAEFLGGNVVVRVDRNSGEVLAIRSYSR